MKLAILKALGLVAVPVAAVGTAVAVTTTALDSRPEVGTPSVVPTLDSGAPAPFVDVTSPLGRRPVLSEIGLNSSTSRPTTGTAPGSNGPTSTPTVEFPPLPGRNPVAPVTVQMPDIDPHSAAPTPADTAPDARSHQVQDEQRDGAGRGATSKPKRSPAEPAADRATEAAAAPRPGSNSQGDQGNGKE